MKIIFILVFVFLALACYSQKESTNRIDLSKHFIINLNHDTISAIFKTRMVLNISIEQLDNYIGNNLKEIKKVSIEFDVSKSKDEITQKITDLLQKKYRIYKYAFYSDKY